MDGIVFFREGTRGWQRSDLCILNNDGLTNISKNPTSFTILHLVVALIFLLFFCGLIGTSTIITSFTSAL